jgi:hypothetical protein
MAKPENVLHVKLEHSEGIQSERDVLSSEKDILGILKTIKRYTLLRTEDLNNRLRIQKKMKDVELNITKLHQTFPSFKIPEILKDEEEYRKERMEKKRGKKKSGDDVDLENQLIEIQERLKKLE